MCDQLIFPTLYWQLGRNPSQLLCNSSFTLIVSSQSPRQISVPSRVEVITQYQGTLEVFSRIGNATNHRCRQLETTMHRVKQLWVGSLAYCIKIAEI